MKSESNNLFKKQLKVTENKVHFIVLVFTVEYAFLDALSDFFLLLK